MSTSPSVRVFVSYSHDSEEHRQRVRALVGRLRTEGVNAIFDQQFEDVPPPKGWPLWMLDDVEAADYVLVVATETYNRRFRGNEKPGSGKGGTWEGATITQELYDAQGHNLKYIPIAFTRDDTGHIPLPLRPTTYYLVSTEEGYNKLYSRLTSQPSYTTEELGPLRNRASSALSGEALELLRAAASATDSFIVLGESLAGGEIQVRGTILIEERENQRRYDRYEAAVQELLNLGLIKDPTGRREIYDVTDAGYRLVEAVK